MAVTFDVAIIGAGIVGLAHAWMASRRGLKVLLLERTSFAQGATVRNFGMIWPIGQPAGELHAIAMRSRELWLELAEHHVLNVEECGAIHVASQPDELAVFEEFVSLKSHRAAMVSASDVHAAIPFANPNVLGGMSSTTELRVDPRLAAQQLASWLATQAQVTTQYGTAVANVSGKQIHCTNGQRFSAKRIVICSGSDLQTLFPDTLQKAGLKLCKLQMLQAGIPKFERMVPHLASGLTLRHYASFQECSSLAELKRRVASETPELEHYGIHVMVSAFPDGRLILGDSHEYGEAVSPFDNRQIDDLIIRELRRLIFLDEATVTQRWHGVYAKHAELPIFEASPADGVEVCVGTGGAGMTMSFGLAERAWNRWEGRE